MESFFAEIVVLSTDDDGDLDDEVSPFSVVGGLSFLTARKHRDASFKCTLELRLTRVTR